MSTLRISNIEAKSVPASATIDEKVKITNSSGDVLVFLDGKTSGITTVGINTTDGNITFDANSNVVVTGIITATKFSGQFEPTSVGIADSIFHTGDTNTAIRFPAVDTITAETSGSERLRIISDGKVGISSSTPTSPLEIHTNASAAWKFRINTSVSDGAGFYQRSNGDFEMVLRDASNNVNYIAGTSGALQFVTSSTEKLRITSDGNITFGHTSSSLAVTNAHIKHISGGRDYWDGTKGDYRAIRFWVYDNAGNTDDVYGMGISASMLELQAHGDIGLFTGGAGTGTGRRNHRATLHDNGIFEFLNGTKLNINASTSPNSHALINLGSDHGNNTETRAIDIDGNWNSGESKSITFTHAASAASIVGQINCVHNSPGSSLRWGRLYHGGDSSAYTMTLDSVSTSSANLRLHDGDLIVANGHGIDFSNTANGSGFSQELLDDYEEGNFDGADISGGGLTLGYSNTGRYVKVGRQVYVIFDITYPSNSDSANISRVSTPYQASLPYGGGWVGWNDLGRPMQVHVSNTSVYFMDNNSSGTAKHLYNSELSGKRLIGGYMLMTNS
tara:strand:- start:78 stop:1760 length:1683 start_codon:yes stop_codon:yes gene_type:complete